MTDSDLENRILDIVAKETRRERSSLTLETPVDDIESLDMVQIIFAVETEFGIYVPTDDERFKLKTLRDVVEGVRTLVAEKEAASPATA